MGTKDDWTEREAATIRKAILSGNSEELAYLSGRYESIYEQLTQALPDKKKATRRDDTIAKASRVVMILDLLHVCVEPPVQESEARRDEQMVRPYA